MKIAIIGFGTVGSGAYEVLQRNRSAVEVKKILDLAVRPGMENVMTTDFDEILNDPEIELVAEVIGGLHPAYDFVSAALKAGKHAVTANKLMVSTYYRELMETAAANGVKFRFTPSAGGGIPWLSNLQRTARADEIEAIEGIMNGTTNYILDKMTKEGASFEDTLLQAQKLGYAERDPSADIDGLDVRCKCAISANLATGFTVNPEEIPVFGIRNIHACDIRRLSKEEKTVKLLASVLPGKESSAMFVQPTAVDSESLTAAVPDNFNLIRLTGKSVGTLAFYGQGAGKDPTGFALVQDILDIAEGAAFSYTYKKAVVDNSKIGCRYYVRTPEMSDALNRVVQVQEETEYGTILFTRSVSVQQMHEIAASLPSTAFIAAFEGVK